MIWVGMIVVFDDELLDKYNTWAAVDVKLEEHLYYYTIAGFFVDILRSKLFSKL